MALQTQDYGWEYTAWIGESAPWGRPIDDSGYINGPPFNYTFPTYNSEICESSRDNQSESSNILWVNTMKNSSLSSLQTIECQLWNATYDVEFVYQNSEQNIIRHNLTYQNPILTISTSDFDNFTNAKDLNCFPKTILATMGAFVVGVSQVYPFSSLSPAGFNLRSNFTLPDVISLKSEQLCEVFEETFRNITLSLFSVPEFLYDLRSLTLEC